MPNTIAQNLQRLVTAKDAISSAITAQGGTVNSGDGLEEFPADIATIPTGSYKVELSILSICLKSDRVTGRIRASSAITVSGNWTMSEFGLLLCTDAVANIMPLSIDNIGKGSPPIQRGYRTDASSSPYTAKISDANNNGAKFCGYMVLNSDINKIVIYTETKTVTFGELLAPSVDVLYAEEGEIEFECYLSTTPKDDGDGNSFNVDEYGVLTLDSSSQITQPITINTSGVAHDAVSDGSSFSRSFEAETYFYIRPYARIGTRYYYGKQIEKRFLA